MNQNGCYIDLHAHLDGSVTVDIAKKLAALQNIALPTDNDEELLALLSVPDSCESLNDFLQCFELPGRLMQTPEGLQNAVTLVLENMGTGRRDLCGAALCAAVSYPWRHDPGAGGAGGSCRTEKCSDSGQSDSVLHARRGQ